MSHGLTAVVLSMRGKFITSYHLNEETIAWLLDSDDSDLQKQPWKRTTREYHHRMAAALCAIARRHRARIGIENIEYARARAGKRSLRGKNGSESIKSIQTLLRYRLQLEALPVDLEIRGVAPTRDCGVCGYRTPESAIVDDFFACPRCDHLELRWINTAREVARRVLWSISWIQPPKAQTTILKRADLWPILQEASVSH
jgi:hypothetical protein